MRANPFKIPYLLAFAASSTGRASTVGSNFSSANQPRARDSGARTPCQQIADIVIAAGDSERKSGKIEADCELAWNCLRSIRFDKEDALDTIESLKRSMQLVPNLAYYKDPSLGRYPRQPLDLIQGLDDIADNIRLDNGIYSGQYDLEVAIHSLIAQAGDFHLFFYGFAMTGLIEFFRPNKARLVSVSPDTKTSPQIFLANDFPELSSPVKTINGQDATAFLELQAAILPFADNHTRYNCMFNKPIYREDRDRTFVAPVLYPGKETTMSFSGLRRGKTWPTIAQVAVDHDWLSISSGLDPYDVLIKSSSAPAASRVSTGTAPSRYATRALPAWMPILNIKAKRLSFGDNDFAMIRVFTFWQHRRNWLTDLELAIQELDLTPTTDILFDLRGNQGGDIANVVSLFKAFFSKSTHYSNLGRLRATSLLDSIGKFEPETLGVFPFEFESQQRLFQDLSWGQSQYFCDPSTGQKFRDWDAFFGPEQLPADQFTNSFGWKAFTYDENTIVDPTPKTRVVLLTDGICGSGCHLLVEMVNREPSIITVKHVTVGGLPQAGGMPLVGGAKTLISAPLKLTTTNSAALLANPGIPSNASKYLPSPPRFEIASAGFPLHDEVAVDDPDQVPLSFVYEQSDCRLFYTKEMLQSSDFIALRAWEAAMTDRSKVQPQSGFWCGIFGCGTSAGDPYCVEGSYSADV